MKWYKATKAAVAHESRGRFERFKAQARTRIDNQLLYMSKADGFVSYTNEDHAEITSATSNIKYGYNITQSMIETLTSKIAKNHPRPFAVPSDGSFLDLLKCRLLNSYLTGLFQHLDMGKHTKRMLKDALVFGSGFLMPYITGDFRIAIDRILPTELFVDETLDNPREAFRCCKISADVLIGRFPEKEKRIRMEATKHSDFHADTGITQTIEVVEAYYLATTKDAKDGRYVVSISEDCVLVDRPYEKTYFPWVKMDFIQRPRGYMGQSLVEVLLSLQTQLNDHSAAIEQIIENCSNPVWLISRESNVDVENEVYPNVPGRAIMYNEMKPELATFNTVPQELALREQDLYQKSFEIAGISQLSAQSQKQPGLNSGKALLTFYDIESERFYSLGQIFENTARDISIRLIDLAKELEEAGQPQHIVVKHGGMRQRLTWKELDVDEDKFNIAIFNVSSLPSKPEGRLQMVEQWVQMGWLDRDTAMQLMDLPDTDLFNHLTLSGKEFIESEVEMMLRNGVYRPPDPLSDLAYAEKYALQVYFRARLDDDAEESQELLRTYILQVRELIAKEQQKQMMQQQQQMAMMGPQGPQQ